MRQGRRKINKDFGNKYPKFLKAKFPEMFDESCIEIAIGEGWSHIVTSLCSAIQFQIDHNDPDQIKVLQIKEKFGGLRFYASGCNDYLQGMISFAESLSYRTCEFCGSTQDIGRTGGWIKTICKECATEEKSKRGDFSWTQREED